MHGLYELKEKLVKELEEFSKKEITASSLATIDTLAHAAKNICKIMETGDGYSEDGGSYRGSYRRDSRGRYSSSYYNAADDMVNKLDELMHTAPEEIKSDIQRLKSRVETMR